MLAFDMMLSCEDLYVSILVYKLTECLYVLKQAHRVYMTMIEPLFSVSLSHTLSLAIDLSRNHTRIHLMKKEWCTIYLKARSRMTCLHVKN